jgi:hypothetical protein
MEVQMPENDVASSKERFEFAYKSLQDNYNKYLDDIYKTIGTLIVGVGIIATSGGARDFLQRSPFLRYTILIALPILTACNVWYLIDHRIESNRIAALLENADYLDLDYFKRYLVTRRLVLRTVACILSLYGILFVTIFTLKSP